MLAVVAATLVFAACTFDPGTIERTPREAVGPETNAKSRLAARKGGSPNGQTPGAAPADPIGVPGTETAALEVDVTNFKERLIGLDSDEINDLMGTRSLERAEPPALIWQYRHQVCTVDVFMFDDGAGSTVDHVEVRPTTGSSVSEKECFTSLLRGNPPGGSRARGAAPQQPVAPAPSTPVGRRAVPSAAPPPGPAQTPSSARPTAPASATPPSSPTGSPPSAPPSDAEDGLAREDSDVDFDFGPTTPNASPNAVPAREDIPTIPGDPPPVLPPPGLPPGPLGALKDSGTGIEIPDEADSDFADPLADGAPKPPPSAVAPKPPAPAATARPSAPPPAPAAPAVAPPRAAPPPTVTATPPAVPPVAPAPALAAPVPTPVAPPSGPAQLAPRTPAATAAAQPKGTPKGAAARPVEDLDDEDLPPDLLRGRLADDDPANTNDDLVE